MSAGARAVFVVLVVVPDNGRYLIVEELDGTYYLPAGKVESGEDLMAAAVRETIEEAGTLIGLSGILGFDHDWGAGGSTVRMRFVFVGYPAINMPPKQTRDRHSRRAAWLTKREIAQLPLRADEVLTWIERYEGGAPLLPCAAYEPRLEMYARP